MEGQEIRGLMEAYSQVYETPEVLNEEVVEEDVEQLMERGAPTDPKARAAYDAQVAKNRSALGNTLLYGNAEGRKPSTLSQPTNRRGGGTVKPAAAPTQSRFAGARDAAFKKAQAIKGSPVVGTKSAPTTTATPGTPPKPAPTGAAKPAPTTPPKPAPTGAAKPAPTTPPKPAPKPGTQAAGPESIKPKTPNPLMKDMPKGPGSMAAPTPAPKKFDIRDRDPRARANFDPRYDKKPINQSFDLFDLVKGHLLDEGYADTEESAMVIMVNMSEAWRESILESHGVELDEAQRARENPEEYERSESSRQSKRERAMNDPHTGINSPAFAEFMRQQMGGKKKKS